MSIRILAFDTSGPRLDIALLCHGETHRFARDVGRGHGERLGGEVQRLLLGCGVTAHDLDAIIVPVGPGSFTGLRIAISFAKGLQAASGTPVYGADTLRAMIRTRADNLEAPCTVLALIDGKKQRYYAALDRKTGHRAYERVFGPVDESILSIRERLRAQPDRAPLCVGDMVPTDDWAPFAQPDPIAGGTADALLRMYLENDPLLAELRETDGPQYLRPSQAEES